MSRRTRQDPNEQNMDDIVPSVEAGIQALNYQNIPPGQSSTKEIKLTTDSKKTLDRILLLNSENLDGMGIKMIKGKFLSDDQIIRHILKNIELSIKNGSITDNKNILNKLSKIPFFSYKYIAKGLLYGYHESSSEKKEDLIKRYREFVFLYNIEKQKIKKESFKDLIEFCFGNKNLVKFFSNTNDEILSSICYAASNGHLEVVRYLTKKFNNLFFIEDQYSNTAFDLATLNGNLGV
jgi:hypothetical protein